MRSSTTVSLAGSAPARSRIARLLASSTVKLPVIWPVPPVIGERMTGAEITLPSSTMANGRPTFSDVTWPNFCAAAQIEAESDVGLAGLLVEALLRVDQILAVDHDALLHRDRPAALLHRQGLDLVRRIAGIGDEPEVELGGLADDLLELRRVLKARHLDQHAVGALLLDDRLLGAHRVDAAVQHLDRLRHRVAHLVGDRGVGQRQLHAAVGFGDVEGAAVAAGQAGRRSAG